VPVGIAETDDLDADDLDHGDGPLG